MPPHQRRTLLDDGSPGSDDWRPPLPWHELRTAVGPEGPIQIPINSLRDPRAPATARFRLAQHLTHSCADGETRTKLLLAQARNLEQVAADYAAPGDADDGRSTSEPPDDSELSSNPAGSSVGGGGAASAAPLLAKSRSQSARALCSASVPAWITLS